MSSDVSSTKSSFHARKFNTRFTGANFRSKPKKAKFSMSVISRNSNLCTAENDMNFKIVNSWRTLRETSAPPTSHSMAINKMTAPCISKESVQFSVVPFSGKNTTLVDITAHTLKAKKQSLKRSNPAALHKMLTSIFRVGVNSHKINFPK